MKQWYQHQLQHQITRPELNKIEYSPVVNLAHLSPILQDLKNYRHTTYYRNFYEDDNFPGRAGADLGLTEEQVRSWLFDDAEHSHMARKNGMNYIEIPAAHKDQLKAEFVRLLAADPDTIECVVNLQLPGQFFAMHVDRLKYSDNNTTKDQHQQPPYRRMLLFVDDWQHGQAFQIGDNFIKWRAGDVFDWDPDNVYHGSSNFGFHERYVIRVDFNYSSPWRLKNQDRPTAA